MNLKSIQFFSDRNSGTSVRYQLLTGYRCGLRAVVKFLDICFMKVCFHPRLHLRVVSSEPVFSCQGDGDLVK